jgi:hypothetical protein
VNATDAGAIADMQFHRDWLLQRKLTSAQGAKFYAWPVGRWSRTAGSHTFLDLARAAGFQTARLSEILTSRFAISPTTSNDKSNMILPILGHNYAGVANTPDSAAETTNINNIITRIQFLASAGMDGILMLHEVTARGAASIATQIETDRLHTLGAAIQTLVAANTLECVTADQLVY